MSFTSALVKTVAQFGFEVMKDKIHDQDLAEKKKTLAFVGQQGARLVLILCLRDIMKICGLGIVLGAAGCLFAAGFQQELLYRNSIGMMLCSTAMYASLLVGVLIFSKQLGASVGK